MIRSNWNLFKKFPSSVSPTEISKQGHQILLCTTDHVGPDLLLMWFWNVNSFEPTIQTRSFNALLSYEYFRLEFAPTCSWSINSQNFPTRSSDTLLGSRVSLDQKTMDSKNWVQMIVYSMLSLSVKMASSSAKVQTLIEGNSQHQQIKESMNDSLVLNFSLTLWYLSIRQ